jgi:hypothetical protein
MKTYARIENGVVAELFTIDVDPAGLFHPSFHWVEAPPGVTENFLHDGTRFTAPPPPFAAPTPTPTLADLQVRVAALTAEIAAFLPTT